MDNSTNQNFNTSSDTEPQISPVPASSPTGNISTPAVSSTPATPPKKQKKFSWPIVVAIVAVVVCAGICLVRNPLAEMFGAIADNTSDQAQIHVKDLTLSYPDALWAITTNEENSSYAETVLDGIYGSIIVFHVNIGQNSSLVNQIIMGLIGKSMDSISDTEKVTINGLTWEKRVATTTSTADTPLKFQIYSCTNGSDFYLMMYKTTESRFDSYLSHAERIFSSAKIDQTSSLPSFNSTNTSSTKNILVGEWDWGNGGYAVIGSDGTMAVYQDSSKSSRNVFSGTYEFSDKVETASGGYLPNTYKITLTIDNFQENGKTIIDAIGEQNIFIFAPNSGGYYDVYNYRTDSYNRAIRVK